MDLLSCIISSCKKIMRIILDLHQIDTSSNYKHFFYHEKLFSFVRHIEQKVALARTRIIPAKMSVITTWVVQGV